jgi:chromosome segregation ATPase
MSDQPLTVGALADALAKFHRDVIAPDIQRIVGDAVSGAEGRLRNEMQGFHDSILKKLGDLETESAAIKIGLKRVEERLDLVEVRLGKVEDRLDGVETALRRLEGRLSRVEKRIDEIAEPQPGLRADVEQLKISIDSLQGRIDALERGTQR